MLQLTRRQLAALKAQAPQLISKPAKTTKRKGGRLPVLGGEPGGWVFELTILLQPRPKQRARHSMRGGRVRTYTPAETGIFEAAVRAACAAEMARLGLEPMRGPVEAKFEFAFTGDAGVWPTSARDGDLENIEKAVQDAMNQCVLQDDRLIVQKTSVKVCAADPYIYIGVRPALVAQ